MMWWKEVSTIWLPYVKGFGTTLPVRRNQYDQLHQSRDGADGVKTIPMWGIEGISTLNQSVYVCIPEREIRLHRTGHFPLWESAYSTFMEEDRLEQSLGHSNFAQKGWGETPCA